MHPCFSVSHIRTSHSLHTTHTPHTHPSDAHTHTHTHTSLHTHLNHAPQSRTSITQCCTYAFCRPSQSHGPCPSLSQPCSRASRGQQITLSKPTLLRFAVTLTENVARISSNLLTIRGADLCSKNLMGGRIQLMAPLKLTAVYPPSPSLPLPPLPSCPSPSPPPGGPAAPPPA